MSKTITKIMNHPAVIEISDERSSGDGFWVYLRSGHCNDEQGLHCIHEDSPTECLRRLRWIEECRCEGCVTDAQARRKSRPIEMPVGTNKQLLIHKLGNLNCMTPIRDQLKAVRPRKMRNVPVPLRRGWLLLALQTINRNRDLCQRVNRGTR